MCAVPLPEASERGRNRRQKKKRRRQLQEQLTATLQTLPLFDDSLGKVTVPKEDPSFKLSIDISEDAVLAAQGVTPSATLCVEVCESCFSNISGTFHLLIEVYFCFVIQPLQNILCSEISAS